jgi:hypothetical protein
MNGIVVPARTMSLTLLMSIGNPLAQGWADNETLSADDFVLTPVFGALPYALPRTPSPPPFTTYRFVSETNSILNSVVLDPSSNRCYEVTTDPEMPDYSILKNAKGKSVALIEWKSHPDVEVRGALQKQAVKDWLKLSPDKS